MTHITVQLPFKGFTEQSQFSAVPPGMTPSCLNVMPIDPWNGRTRIGTRNGTRVYSSGDVQFLSSYRIYEAGTLVEKIILVRGGKIYFGDPQADVNTTEATVTLFGDGTTQTTAFLNTSGLVEGVQFNEHFYFVDGDHYVLVHLATPTSATAVTVWGDDSPKHGPFHTDPSGGYTAGDGTRATLICRWGSRLVLAGYKNTPNIWFACSPDDTWPIAGGSGGSLVDGWSGSNPIGAVTGTSANEYGTLGDPIVAIFPFAQSGLMFACTNSFSFLTTDPVFEESVNMVSLTRSIGIAGRRAWCQSQEKGAFILANDGLYFINANDFNFNRANRVSAGRLDSFFLRLDFGTPAIGGNGTLSGGTLKNIATDGGSGSGAKVNLETEDGGITDSATAETIDIAAGIGASLVGGLSSGEVFPVLCYDPDREGVWVFLTVNGVEASSLHLYYDLKTDSFWPQRFASTKMLGPVAVTYIGTSRSKEGRLFLGSTQSISILQKGQPVGIDSFDSELGKEAQISQFVRSSLTLGPIIAPLPYRAMLSELRVDLADDVYELPSGFTNYSTAPVLSIAAGDTAQSALGLQTDSLFVINLNPLNIDCGAAVVSSPFPTYDGGTSATPSPDFIDGRYAVRPFGEYAQTDPFAIGTTRVYDGPGDWLIRWANYLSSDRWTIAKLVGASYEIEYYQLTPDSASPNGSMVTIREDPISPDRPDNADVSGASFPESEVTEIGSLVPGRNTAKKCRIRSEAMYITVASDGRPWAIERMSAIVSQVGKSRGDP